MGQVDTVGLYNYLVSKGVRPVECSSDQWRGTCPICGKEEHFYVNKFNGLWDCKSGKCGQRGSFASLKRMLKDEGAYIVPLFSDTAMMRLPDSKSAPQKELFWEQYEKCINLLNNDEQQLKWLREVRGIDAETVKFFKLGLKPASCTKPKTSRKNDGKAIDWIIYPLSVGGKLVNLKFRSGGGYEKDFSFVSGRPLPLFNQDNVVKDQPLIICEGEFDAMVLWQNGFKNVLSPTAGASSFKPEWYDFVVSLNAPIIYLCYDTDEAGQSGAKELLSRFGDDVARIIKVPEGKDATDYFVKFKHTAEEFNSVLDQAALEDVEYVYGPAQVLDDIISDISTNGLDSKCIPTQYPNLNKLIGGGFFPGELVALSARAKVGKTTLAQNIAHHVCKNLGLPVLFMCLEMPPTRLMRKMVSMCLKIDDMDLTADDFIKAKEYFSGVPFYYSYPYKNLSFDLVSKIFTKARKRYGIKLAVFDNLHFLCRDVKHIVQEVGNLSRSFKLLAERLEIPIILIVQPRKVGGGAMISSEDFKDSSAIKADCDKTILLHREPNMAEASPDIGSFVDIPFEEAIGSDAGALGPFTIVNTDASRYSAGGTAMMYFEGAKSYFRIPTIEEVSEYAKQRAEAKNNSKGNGKRGYAESDDY